MCACTDIDPEKQSHMEIHTGTQRKSNSHRYRQKLKHRDLIKQVLPPERKGS